MTEYSISNNLCANKISNMDHFESAVLNKPDEVNCDKIVHLPHLNNSFQENVLHKCKLPLSDVETIGQSLKQTTESNVFGDKTNVMSNNKLFTKLNIITNEDIKQVLKKISYDYDFLTKNSCCNTNNLQNIKLKFVENSSINVSSDFPGIHDEFQAELDTLDQLNNSLCDIEKMDRGMSVKTDEQSTDSEINDHCTPATNNLNFKTIFNAAYSSNDRATSVSKLNAVSSNMMSVDNTVTGFSIQMFEQLIQDEELRAKQHRTILCLKEKTLINRLKWEVTIYDLQMKNFKNRPGHEKQLQLFKQKYRGIIKKLEHSLSQVKRLGRVIESVYRQRLIMLQEHLQHLRLQSSSKKVIRKLKSLDHVPKKDEFACQSPDSHTFKHYDKTDFIDTVESEQINENPVLCNATAKSWSTSSSTTFELDKSKFNLRGKTTSHINIETELKQDENVKVKKSDEQSSQCAINKSIQTSKSLCNNISKKNIKFLVPIDFSYINESSGANLTKDKILVSLLPTLRQCPSESSISTDSEQSDMDLRVTALKEQLEARKLESLRLKNEQKKLRLENLKAKEQFLLKQIELYDKKIEESKKSLLDEVERKNIQVTKSSVKLDSSSLKHISGSILHNIICCKHGQNVHVPDRETRTNRMKYDNLNSLKKPSNHDVISLNKPVELQQKNFIKPKRNLNPCTINSDLVKTDNYDLDSNQVYEVLPSPKEPVAIEEGTLNESHNIQTEVNDIPLKCQSGEMLIHASYNLEENLKVETSTNKINEITSKHFEVPVCEYSISNQERSDTFSGQELYLEKNIDTEKSKISYGDVNYSDLNKSSSGSSDQKKLFINSNVNYNNVCERKENGRFRIYEIGMDEHYSPDFTSDENTSEFLESYKFNKHNGNMIELHNEKQDNESSYEEERSEGDVIFEDKTCIEQYSDSSDAVVNEKPTDDKVDDITNRIFDSLLIDTKKTLKSNMSKPLFLLKKSDLNNVTEETPLLMILKREQEHQNRFFLSEKATTISDALLKCHLLPSISSTLQMYLQILNEVETEKLTQYLNWSSKTKKLKLTEYFNFQHKTSDVDSDESFEMFYQKYQERKKSRTFQDDSNSDVMLSQTKQESEKLKLEQMRIEEEIQRLRVSEEAQFFLREIPNKPPPPYKSPTKKKALIDMPYTSNEIHKIVLNAASQLCNESHSSVSEDCTIDSESSLNADYKTLIFDYCKEIAQDTFINEKNVPIWKRSKKTLKQFRTRPNNSKDLSDMVIRKMYQIIDIDECEEKVNKFVVKQMHEEDSKWTDFQMDEMAIQNDIVQNLMKNLVCETITNIKTNFYLKFFGRNLF